MDRSVAPKRVGDFDEPRAPKRRSTQACQTCRARKVRCDITVSGKPCTNCRLDSADCVVVTSRRGPKSRAPNREQSGADSRLHGQPDRPASSPNQISSPNQVQTCGQLAQGTSLATVPSHEGPPPEVSPLPPGSVHELAVGLTFDYDEDDAVLDPTRGSSKDIVRITAAEKMRLRNHLGGLRAPQLQQDECSPGTLPPFIRPLPATLSSVDMAYLEQKDALAIPEPQFRDALLRSYIVNVHPFMPIVELRDLLDAVLSNGKTGQVSLLLFQAIMFAGLPAMDPELLPHDLYENTKQAREVFFARARLLHHLECETDTQGLLQSLLLMSLWHGGRHEHKNTWYYTGLALSLAQTMGLHRDPDQSTRNPCLRRRLWWSLYIRDRLIAIGTRRPMRIKDDEYTTSMLSGQDFAHSDLDESHVEYLERRPDTPHADANTCLHHMCIELAKLCVCIGHVLTSQYTTLGKRSAWTGTLMVVPRAFPEPETTAAETELHDKEITTWFETLHPTVQKLARKPAYEPGGPPPGQLQRHWLLIDIVRLTLVSLLHKPQGFRPTVAKTTGNSQAADIINASRKKLKAAAQNLTRITFTMLVHDHTRYLTTTGIPALLSAGLTHLLELDSPDDDARDASTLRFSQIWQVLQRLQVVYGSADSAIAYLSQIIRKSGISARVPAIAALAPNLRIAHTKRQMPAMSAPNDAISSNSRSVSAHPPSHVRTRMQESQHSSSQIDPRQHNLPHHADASAWERQAVFPQISQVDADHTCSQRSRIAPLQRAENGTPGIYTVEALATSHAAVASLADASSIDTAQHAHLSEPVSEGFDLRDMFGQGMLFGPFEGLEYGVDAFDFCNDGFSWLNDDTMEG